MPSLVVLGRPTALFAPLREAHVVEAKGLHVVPRHRVDGRLVIDLIQLRRRLVVVVEAHEHAAILARHGHREALEALLPLADERGHPRRAARTRREPLVAAPDRVEGIVRATVDALYDENAELRAAVKEQQL